MFSIFFKRTKSLLKIKKPYPFHITTSFFLKKKINKFTIYGKIKYTRKYPGGNIYIKRNTVVSAA